MPFPFVVVFRRISERNAMSRKGEGRAFVPARNSQIGQPGASRWRRELRYSPCLAESRLGQERRPGRAGVRSRDD